MKNPGELFVEMLVQKERDLVRIKKELEALRLVASLLRDNEDGEFQLALPDRAATNH
jgi:hypothetical protein